LALTKGSSRLTQNQQAKNNLAKEQLPEEEQEQVQEPAEKTSESSEEPMLKKLAMKNQH